MIIELPEHVTYILHTLAEHGHEGYAVGGCVRDVLLGRQPQDWDITTDAAPAQVRALFRRTLDTGLQHGTVTVMLDHTGYEVTTDLPHRRRLRGRQASEGGQLHRKPEGGLKAAGFYDQCDGVQ